MHFDWTLSFGTLLGALAIVAGTWASISRLYGLLDKRLTVFENVLDVHAKTLTAHATRMEKQEDMLIKLSGDLQRVIGRIESWAERRTNGE